MSVDIGETFRDGMGRVTTQAGAVFVAVFALAAVARYVAWNSLFAAVLRWVRLNVGLADYYGEMYAFALRWFLALLESETTLAYLEGSIPTILGLIVAIWATEKLVGIGAIRWFVEKQSGRIEVGHFLDRFVWTVVNLVVGGLVYFVVVAVGFAFFVVPGIYLGVALYFFKFEVVVEGENAFTALGNSWNLTRGNRLLLFVLGIVFFFVVGALWQLTGVVSGFSLLLGAIVTAVGWAVGSVAWIAIASDAYNQLRDVSGPDDGAPESATANGPATL